MCGWTPCCNRRCDRRGVGHGTSTVDSSWCDEVLRRCRVLRSQRRRPRRRRNVQDGTFGCEGRGEIAIRRQLARLAEGLAMCSHHRAAPDWTYLYARQQHDQLVLSTKRIVVEEVLVPERHGLCQHGRRTHYNSGGAMPHRDQRDRAMGFTATGDRWSRGVWLPAQDRWDRRTGTHHAVRLSSRRAADDVRGRRLGQTSACARRAQTLERIEASLLACQLLLPIHGWRVMRAASSVAPFAVLVTAGLLTVGLLIPSAVPPALVPDAAAAGQSIKYFVLASSNYVSKPRTWTPDRTPRLGTGLKMTQITWTSWGGTRATGAAAMRGCTSHPRVCWSGRRTFSVGRPLHGESERGEYCLYRELRIARPPRKSGLPAPYITDTAYGATGYGSNSLC